MTQKLYLDEQNLLREKKKQIGMFVVKSLVQMILLGISLYMFYKIGDWKLFGAIFFWTWGNNLGLKK